MSVCEACGRCDVCDRRVPSKGGCAHTPVRNPCPHWPDLTAEECGTCADNRMRAQNEAAIAMIPGLEQNRSTKAVAERLRAIFGLPKKLEEN